MHLSVISEFIVKLFANAKPATYLEWGTGTSTSFYPLLASGSVYAIDGYPPWSVTLLLLTHDFPYSYIICLIS